MQLNNENLYDKLRKEGWNNALHAYGTAYIYNLRGKSVQKKLQLITFLGILVPLLVGSIALGYGYNNNILDVVLKIVIPISVIQLIVSTWSLVARWNEANAYYMESSISNSNLSIKYQNLSKFPPKDLGNLRDEMEKIDIEKTQRDIQDKKYSFSEKEKRKGMRYSLRKFERSCAGCGEIPKSMGATDCDICGKF